MNLTSTGIHRGEAEIFILRQKKGYQKMLRRMENLYKFSHKKKKYKILGVEKITNHITGVLLKEISYSSKAHS